MLVLNWITFMKFYSALALFFVQIEFIGSFILSIRNIMADLWTIAPQPYRRSNLEVKTLFVSHLC